MTRWFRSHAVKLDNPKVQLLSDAMYRAWDSLLCVACKYEGVLPSIEDTAFALRKSEAATERLINALIAAELFVRTERGVEPHEWNEWQYKSDVSTNRVKQFRERQRNVSVTPSETEPDTDTEQNRTTPNGVVGAKAPKATRKVRLPSDWKPTDEQLAYATAQGCTDPADTAERFRLHHQSKGTLGQDWDLGFKYWCRNEKTFRKATPENRQAQRDAEIEAAIINSRSFGQ